MISAKKPKSITVIVLDRNTNKGKSFTVYGSPDEVYYKLKKCIIGK